LLLQIKSRASQIIFWAGVEMLYEPRAVILWVMHLHTYRILLRKAGRDRIALMLDSPWHAYDQSRFTITERGVQNMEEKRASKNTEAEW
jgi:hypothetical protein